MPSNDLPLPPFYNVTQTRLERLMKDKQAISDRTFMSAETARAITAWHHDDNRMPASHPAFHCGFIRNLDDQKSTRSRYWTGHVLLVQSLSLCMASVRRMARNSVLRQNSISKTYRSISATPCETSLPFNPSSAISTRFSQMRCYFVLLWYARDWRHRAVATRYLKEENTVLEPMPVPVEPSPLPYSSPSRMSSLPVTPEPHVPSMPRSTPLRPRVPPMSPVSPTPPPRRSRPPNSPEMTRTRPSPVLPRPQPVSLSTSLQSLTDDFANMPSPRFPDGNIPSSSRHAGERFEDTLPQDLIEFLHTVDADGQMGLMRSVMSVARTVAPANWVDALHDQVRLNSGMARAIAFWLSDS
jgi:hypothetical protein